MAFVRDKMCAIHLTNLLVNTYIAPQAAYRSCSGAFVSQIEWAYSL